MRSALALLLVLLAGCAFQGLGSSTKVCQVGEPVETGVRIVIPEPEAFVGYCVELRGGQAQVLGKVPPDGIVWFPIDEVGRYSFRVQVEDPSDPYCAHTSSGHFDHDGEGLVDVEAMTGRVCT